MAERKAVMHFELIIGMVKQIETNTNGRAELPWEMINSKDFVPISTKPDKISFEEYNRAVNCLTTVNLIPCHLDLEKVLKIPQVDN